MGRRCDERGRPLARSPGDAIIWHLTQPPSGGLKKRLDDQLQFLAETMRRFNAQTARYLREELQCQQLINAGNWKTVNPIRLNDVERWTYAANEVMAVNRYYDTVHLGPERAWRVNKGDRFQSMSRSCSILALYRST